MGFFFSFCGINIASKASVDIEFFEYFDLQHLRNDMKLPPLGNRNTPFP